MNNLERLRKHVWYMRTFGLRQYVRVNYLLPRANRPRKGRAT